MEVVVYLTSCKARVAGVDVLPFAKSWMGKRNAWEYFTEQRDAAYTRAPVHTMWLLEVP